MKNKIKQSLIKSVDQLPHTAFEQIANLPIIKMDEHDFITKQEMPNQRKQIISYKRAFPVFACFIIMFFLSFGWVSQNLIVDTIIDLDINPSFEITVNKKENVLHVKGLNKEAESILEGHKYRGNSIEDTIQSLILSLNKANYLNSEKNNILLSISSKDDKYAEKLSERLSFSILECFQDTKVKPKIITQRLYLDNELKKNARNYQISNGKLQFIDTIVNQISTYSKEELASYSINQLMYIIDQNDLSIPEELLMNNDGLDDITVQNDENDENDENDDDDENDENDDDGHPQGSSVTTLPTLSNSSKQTEKYPKEMQDIEDDEGIDDDKNNIKGYDADDDVEQEDSADDRNQNKEDDDLNDTEQKNVENEEENKEDISKEKEDDMDQNLENQDSHQSDEKNEDLNQNEKNEEDEKEKKEDNLKNKDGDNDDKNDDNDSSDSDD